MKIVLRERTTGLWLKPCGRWQASSLNARGFATSHDANAFSMELRLLDIEVCFIPADTGAQKEPTDPLAEETISPVSQSAHNISPVPSLKRAVISSNK